jgi:hypothetical protein
MFSGNLYLIAENVLETVRPPKLRFEIVIHGTKSQKTCITLEFFVELVPFLRNCTTHDLLCGLEVRVPACRSRGPGLIPDSIILSEK